MCMWPRFPPLIIAHEHIEEVCVHRADPKKNALRIEPEKLINAEDLPTFYLNRLMNLFNRDYWIE